MQMASGTGLGVLAGVVGAAPPDDDYVDVEGVDPVEDALQKCFHDVIQPVAVFLCAIGWRPFPFLTNYVWYHRVLAVAYPVLVALLLSAEYVFRIAYVFLVDEQRVLSEVLLQLAVIFILWGYGLWFFRREEGQAFQEVSALIETVYLRCGRGSDGGGGAGGGGASSKLTQTALTATLRTYLSLAWSALAVYIALALWIAFTAAFEVAETYSDVSWWTYALIAVPTILGLVAENAVIIATILTYWICVRVHVRYADWLREELMARRIDLPNAEREIVSLRRLVNQTNRGWATPVSILAFSLITRAFIFQVIWALSEEAGETAQGIVGSTAYLILFVTTLYPAALFTDKSKWIGDAAWGIRADQSYRTATYASCGRACSEGNRSA